MERLRISAIVALVAVLSLSLPFNVGKATAAVAAATTSASGSVFEALDGGADTATTRNAPNVAMAGGGIGESYAVRTQIKNTGAAIGPTNANLFFDRNDGYWTKVGTTGPVVGPTGTDCTDTNFTCSTIATTNDVGRWNSIVVSQAGTVWVSYYDNTDKNLVVARYVGIGGSGCATAAWECTILDSSGDVGDGSSMALDSMGNPWIVYRHVASVDLKVARYVDTGGTGCDAGVTKWSCSLVDGANGFNVGANASLAFDKTGTAWVSYRNGGTEENLKVARYVASGGTGCEGSSDWTCFTVDTAAQSFHTSLAFDGDNNPWITYYDGANLDVKLAKYVGSGGTGCDDASWQCSVLDGASSMTGETNFIAFGADGLPWVAFSTASSRVKVARFVGSSGTGCSDTAWTCSEITDTNKATNIALDAVGNPWITYRSLANHFMLARYVGSGGTGCVSSTVEWTCTTLDSNLDNGFYASLTFDSDGVAHISYFTSSGFNLKYLRFKPGSQIVPTNSSGANTGDTLSESHVDMAAPNDTTNRDDVDCIGGGTFNNGKFSELGVVSSFSLPAGTVTPQCTELSFAISTMNAVAGQTYRFAVSLATGQRTDRGSIWRGLPTTVAYATFAISSSGGIEFPMQFTIAARLTFTVSSATACLVSNSTGTTSGAGALDLTLAEPGVPYYNSQNISLSTNAASGAVVKLKGSPLNSLTGTIPPIVANYDSPAAMPSAGTAAFGFTTNAPLGGLDPNRFTNPVKWAPLGTSGDQVGQMAGLGDLNFCVGYAVQSTVISPSGTYQSTITYTAIPTF